MRIRSRPSANQTGPLMGFHSGFTWSGSYGNNATGAANAGYVGAKASSLREMPAVIPVETMMDSLTPDYHGKLRRGEFLPPRAMSRSQDRRSVVNVAYGVGGVGKITSSESDLRWRGAWFANHTTVSSPVLKTLFSAGDINAIAIEAKARLNSQGMDYLTSMVELRQTLSMFTSFRANLTSRIERLAREFQRKHKRSKFANERAAWDAFSAFWLEARFGWRVLWYDIQSLQSYIETKDKEDAIVSASAREEKRQTSVAYGPWVGYSNTFHGSLRPIFRSDLTEIVSVGYAGRLDFSQMGNPGLLNTAWEIIPFSLVVDMFFNVQSNILAFTQAPINFDSIPNSGWVSRKRTGAVEVEFDYRPGSGLRIDTLDVDTRTSGTGLENLYLREPFGDPKVSISFKPNVSGLKVVDFVTLVLPLSRAVRSLIK